MAPTIIIKGADNGSAVVVWDREDYLKEAYEPLENKDVYVEAQNDPCTLIYTIARALEKIRTQGNLSNDTRNYFLIKDLKFARFYLYLRFLNVCIMFLADPLFQIVDSIHKMSPHF